MKVFRQGGVLKGDLVCLRFWVVRIPSFNIFPERSFQIAPRRQPPRFLTLAFAKLSCSTRALGSLIPWFLWSLPTLALLCSPAKVEQACSTLPHTQAHWVSSFPFCTTLEHAGRAHPGQHHAVCYLLLCLKKPTRCIGIWMPTACHPLALLSCTVAPNYNGTHWAPLHFTTLPCCSCVSEENLSPMGEGPVQQVLPQHAVHQLSAQVLVQNWRPPSGHIKERQIKDPDVSFLTRRLFFSQRLWRTNEGI